MVGYTDETDVMKQAGIADKRDFIGSKAHVKAVAAAKLETR